MLEFLEISPVNVAAGDKYGIPSRFHRREPDHFSQSAFHPVSHHRIPDTLTDQKAETAVIKSIGKDPNHQETVRYA